MTGPNHVWIVTEQALNANNVPSGVLGLELHYSNNEREHIRVSLIKLESVINNELEIKNQYYYWDIFKFIQLHTTSSKFSGWINSRIRL